MKKNILIIGGCGYIGSRLYDHLSMFYNVTSIDLEWFGKTNANNIKRDYNTLTKNDLGEYTHIVLLAGHSSVSMCDDLKSCYDNNVVNFLNLIGKLFTNQVFIYASSAAVYGSNPQLLDESFPIGKAKNYYDYTKICNENIVELLDRKNTVGLRLGTVAGFSKNMRAENLLNALSLSAIKNNKIKITSPHLMRSALGITDLCRAISTIINGGEIKRNIYNLTSINDTILNFGKTIQRLSGCEMEIDESVTTSYSFNCSNELFRNDYNFEFDDTVESIYRGISDHYEDIIWSYKRIARIYL